MEAMRMNWTDDRLDDLSRRIDERFKQVDERFDSVEAKIDVTGRELTARLDDLNRTLLQVGGGIIATLIGAIAAVVVAG